MRNNMPDKKNKNIIKYIKCMIIACELLTFLVSFVSIYLHGFELISIIIILGLIGLYILFKDLYHEIEEINL